MTITRMKGLAAAFILAIIALPAWADFLTSEKYGYAIDFPEGFNVISGEEDGSSALIQHSFMPVSAMLKVWPAENYKDAKTALTDTYTKLSATGETASFTWRNQNCVIGQFSMENTAVKGKQSGWACAVPLPFNKGMLTLLTYAEDSKAYDADQFMLSVLDSIMIDRGSFHESGLVTQFAFPKKGAEKVNLTIAGKKIVTTLDKEDVEASQFVIDREFQVFKLYVNTKLWKEAWQRFYRQIARDSMGRLKKCAFDIQNALSEEAAKKDPENPDAALAQMLLNWVQYFEYDRTAKSSPDKADIASLPAVLKGKGNDCDARSMLCAVLLKHMGIDSCIFISNTYGHAMLGVNLNGKLGQTIEANGKSYLVGETTAKDLTFGKMDANMADKTKWIAVVWD